MKETPMQPARILQRLRWSALFLGVSNSLAIIFGIILIIKARQTCGKIGIAPFLVIVLISCIRIPVMICTAMAQQSMATAILNSDSEECVFHGRQQKRERHRCWIWCTRIAIAITVLQFLDVAYILFNLTHYVYQDRASSSNCVLELALDDGKMLTFFLFMFIVCLATLVQSCAGSDVLRWRSFYASESNFWKAHYEEVFDHGIREALCCLGRVKYIAAPGEDDIYSVAQLLGDLVTYRASGAGHLQFLAGLALLQKCGSFPELRNESLEMPSEKIHEAAVFHQFAEAAYTGLLLDVGRNPLTFPCAWLYRQGIFCLWSRNKRPTIEGDNWWRGHAAAFLRHVKLTPDALKKGRVNQGSCKAAYFIVVAHHLKSVVIAVRGTETPEDLITDGLGRECSLSIEVLDGLINHNGTHYGHSGVVEAAEELYMQMEGNSTHGGYLSSLLGVGGECEGYNLRIVGHSLGGAIAALLGFRLYRQFPNLHVYAFGPLPCVDFLAANLCSNFVTSIVLNHEFSSRLSVASISRLRAAAVNALSQDSLALSTMLSKLPHYYFCHGHFKEKKDVKELKQVPHIISLSENEVKPIQHSCQLADTVPINEAESFSNIPEMFVPGLVIHIVPVKKDVQNPLRKRWSTWDGGYSYKAYIANRESFKDIIVSPAMFLDHLPWRCYSAIQQILKMENLSTA